MRKAGKNTKRVATYGLLIAVAFALSYLEYLIPFDFGIPGIKLGLANIAVLFALYRLGVGGAIAISLVKAILSGFAFNGAVSILYSVCGAALSLAAMIILKKLRFSAVTVSAVGGVMHNLGQILCAMALTETPQIITYFPVLILTGILTGVLTGIVTGLIISRLERNENV